MKDKELLLKAIDSYDLYSHSLRLTLHALVDLSIDDITSISPTELSKLLKIGRGVIYYNLRILLEDGIIKKTGIGRNRIGLYKLNIVKLKEITEIYEKKSKYI